MAKNFDAIECDVWITKDNYFVINHDPIISTTNNEQLTISDSTLDELKNNCKDITLLDDYLSICINNGNMCVLDIKQRGTTTQQVRLLVDKIRTLGLESSTLILSYDKETILNFQGLTTAELFFVFNSNLEEQIDFCVNNNINACMNYKLVTKDIVNTLHAKNLKVNAWTVDEFFTYMHLASFNVDYITSDFFN